MADLEENILFLYFGLIMAQKMTEGSYKTSGLHQGWLGRPDQTRGEHFKWSQKDCQWEGTNIHVTL